MSPADLVVSHPSIRHRRLADAHGIGDLGNRAVDEGVPRTPPTGMATRPASLARGSGRLVHRNPPGCTRRGQLRPLRRRGSADPVRLALAHGRGRVGCDRHVAARRSRGHLAGDETHPSPVLALDPPVQLRRLPAHQSPCRVCRNRQRTLALPGHRRRDDRRRGGRHDLPAPPSPPSPDRRPVQRATSPRSARRRPEWRTMEINVRPARASLVVHAAAGAHRPMASPLIAWVVPVRPG